MSAATRSGDDPRKTLIRRIQAMRMTLAPLREDDVWRDFLAAQIGESRLSAMTPEQLHRVPAALEAAGAGAARSKNPRAAAGGYKSRFADQPAYAKARALWINLARARKVGDRSDAALDAFIAGRVGQDLGKLTNRQWDAVIKVLSDWVAR